MAITSFLFQEIQLSFVCYGEGVEPKKLIDCSSNLTECFIQQFSDQDIETEGVKSSLESQFRAITERMNKKIHQNSQCLKSIDRNLQDGLVLTKESIQQFIERDEDLQRVNTQSLNLASQADNFKKVGTQFKEDIMRQKYKLYVTIGLFLLLFYLIFCKVL